MKGIFTMTVLMGFLLNIQAGGAVIDAFLEGAQTVSKPASSGGTWVSGPAVSLEQSLFSTRTMRVQYGSQSLTVDSTLGRLLYEVDDYGGTGNGRGYFEVVYSSPEAVNLLADGSTAFELSFASMNYGTSFAPLSVGVRSGGSSVRAGAYYISDPDGSVLRFEFSAFKGIDFSRVDEITVEGFRVPEGSFFELNSIRTVPEPAAAWFPIVSMSLLWWRRQRPRRA